MRQPIDVLGFYEDCSGEIAVATEVAPWFYGGSFRRFVQWMWYQISGRAPRWDVIGTYVTGITAPGYYSNCSWTTLRM